ncbi:MAG: tyrosine-type recombinase/integrase [Proteobacteria bacterium]|nr:tyrosine-type recombinase/integrase [Pseudomonadota bacterium]
MVNTTKRLGDTEVRQARPREKEYNLADGRGLYLRVKPNGTKLWIFNYFRPYTRKRANISLGQYPDVSLTKAREFRQEYLSLLVDNIDPKQHRIDENKKESKALANTFELVARKWFKIKKANISESYAKRVLTALEIHIFPKMGTIPIHKVNAPDAIEIIEPIADRQALETVRKLCRWINEIMVYAVNTGVIYANPLAGIGKAFQPPKSVNMPTIRPEELPQFMRKLGQARITLATRLLIEWQLHTMVRPGEAAGTRWDEIDFEKELWEIPAHRLKKRRGHIVPLAPQSIALLEAMKPISGHREHVFPSDKNPRDHRNKETANMALKRMGYKGKLVSHGLRALASTTLNEQGFDPEIIESALAHSDKNAVRAAYNHAEYLERRRVLMCWWSDHIEEAATGRKPDSQGAKHLRAVN